MRRHGWGGALPASDDEARLRIVDAARVIVRATGTAPTVAQVADALSVTRPTVYRYFPSAEALLLAAASDGVASFLDDIARVVDEMTDPADVVVEGIAFTYEEIERRTEVALILGPSHGSGGRELTSEVAVDLGRSLLEATSVDWSRAGFGTDADLDELVRFMLRMLQSLLLDPEEPPLDADSLRTYLRTWVAPAVTAFGRRTRPPTTHTAASGPGGRSR